MAINKQLLLLVLCILVSACSIYQPRLEALNGNQEANLQAFCYGQPSLRDFYRVPNWRQQGDEWVYVPVINANDFHIRAMCERQPDPWPITYSGQ
jgi:hypothetical protein